MLLINKIPSWVSLVKLALVLYAATAQAAVPGVCAFTAPEGWVQTKTRWEGECRAGYAEGLGVLKEFEKQKVKRFFFGRIKNGGLERGVIDQAEGYMAGDFANGRAVPSVDRQRFIRAFAEAEKAAREAATRFATAGNKASARFYQAKAKELRQQMD